MHDDAPIQADLSDAEVVAMAAAIHGSTYCEYLQPLSKAVTGRVVERSLAGVSGFVLFLGGGGWVAAYQEDGKLRYALGRGEVSAVVRAAIDSPLAADGREPQAADLPYAEERCDLERSLARSHGQPISGLAIGGRCFNFCFEDGHELETMLVQAADGRPALRVFWEQW